MIVQNHRDALKVIPSVSALGAGLREVFPEEDLSDAELDDRFDKLFPECSDEDEPPTSR